jgi:hypothetical protein
MRIMRHVFCNYNINYEKFAVSGDLQAKTHPVITAANRVGKSETHTLKTQSGEALSWHSCYVASKHVPPSIMWWSFVYLRKSKIYEGSSYAIFSILPLFSFPSVQVFPLQFVLILHTTCQNITAIVKRTGYNDVRWWKGIKSEMRIFTPSHFSRIEDEVPNSYKATREIIISFVAYIWNEKA